MTPAPDFSVAWITVQYMFAEWMCFLPGSKKPELEGSPASWLSAGCWPKGARRGGQWGGAPLDATPWSCSGDSCLVSLSQAHAGSTCLLDLCSVNLAGKRGSFAEGVTSSTRQLLSRHRVDMNGMFAWSLF